MAVSEKRPAGSQILFRMLKIAVWILPATVFLRFMLFGYPLDGDETLRLAETQFILSGKVPFYDALMVVSFPGFWFALAPLNLLIPPALLPIAGRALGLFLFFLSIAAIYFLARKDNRHFAAASTAIFATLFALGAPMLFKAAECRPDALATLALLVGGGLFCSAETSRERIWSLLLFGAAIALRLEYALAMFALLTVWALKARSRIAPPRSIFLFAIPPALVAIVLFAISRARFFDLLIDIPTLAQIASLGRGSTSEQYTPAMAVWMVAIAALGIIELLIRLIHPEKETDRSFALFALSATLLIFLFHLKMGAVFLQNFWGQIYILAYFAAGLLIRPAGKLNLLHVGPSLKFAISLALAVVTAVSIWNAGQRAYAEYHPDMDFRMANWQRILHENSADAKAITFGVTAIRPMQLVKLNRYLEGYFQGEFTACSNDFRFLNARQIPENIGAKPSTLIRLAQASISESSGEKIVDILKNRFPQALFIRDAKKLTPTEYMIAEMPDVFSADDQLRKWAQQDDRFRDFLKQNYRLKLGPGEIPIFIREEHPKN